MTKANTLATLGNAPAFAAYVTSAVTVTASQWQKLVLAGESFDTAGAYNNTGSTVTLNGLSVPSYSFCPPVAGYYFFSAGANANAGSTVVSIQKNAGEIFTAGWGGGGANSVSGLIYLNGTGDYVNAALYPAGTALVNAVQLNFLTGCLVRGA